MKFKKIVYDLEVYDWVHYTKTSFNKVYILL